MKRFSTAALLVAMMGMAGYSELARAADDGVKGTISAVTVYRGQALVTREVDLANKAGLAEIVVTELPERLLPGSLFAEADGGVEIRSVSYRERAVASDVRDDVKKIDTEIRAVTDKIAANNVQRGILLEQKAYLEKLSNFTAPTATVEMSKGVLNAEQLKALTDYQFTQRKAIGEQELTISNATRDLQEQVNLLQRKRSEITNGSSKTLREAVVFVNQPAAGGKLRLRYLVDGATWMPSYNVRADAEKKNATVEYQASIQQMSGEEWSNVTMTLSTASPNLVASAPLLNPLSISLAIRPAGASLAAIDGKTIDGFDTVLRDQQRAAEEVRNTRDNNWGMQGNGQGGGNGGGGAFGQQAGGRRGGATTVNGGKLQVLNEDDQVLNKLADQRQFYELVAAEGKRDSTIRSNAGEGIVVTYTLKNATSLPSRADRQLIQIKSFAIKSQFYKVAVPVLTNYVYDEATLTNNGDTVLLAGPLSSYVGGQYVGSGEIPTVAVGQAFSVGFGIDSSLRAARERTDKTESVQGGNKVVKYTYHVTIENYGAAAVDVRIMDRMPTAKETEVKINFGAAEKVALSADTDYQQFDRKKGILRWDITVPPQKNRAEAFAMDYRMEMEYDKNLAISAAGATTIKNLEEELQKSLLLTH